MRERRRRYDEAIGERHREAELLATRERRRTLLTGGLVACLWCAVGLAGVGAALHVATEEIGWVWFWGGLAVGNAGILGTLLWIYARLRDRGH